jgi:MoaA/NifB/PqqE/SkfB family radical SAM enzyme
MRMNAIIPERIRIDASTVCQLKCPSCPTTSGQIARHLKSGFLKAADFRRLLDDNPQVKSVELSNWGEALLNPQLSEILEYAHGKGINLSLANGVNLDRVKPQVLEDLVKYQMCSITCSIDGASRETYSIYRVGGDFDRVIGNIELINSFKQRYRSRYPKLKYQFVAFGHNEHEIQRARALAARLKMGFALKLNWDDLYDSPFSQVRDHALIARESGLGVGTRSEYRKKRGYAYLQKGICTQMWNSPQINFDGRVLGCCVNYWKDYGNAFGEKLTTVLNNEPMRYARLMLRGKARERADIPCTTCKFYSVMKDTGSWITHKDIYPTSGIRALLHWVSGRKVWRTARHLMPDSFKGRALTLTVSLWNAR